jgi:hypothetical protein
MWMGIRTSPFGYNPTVPVTLFNSMVYKNRGQGLFVSLSLGFVSLTSVSYPIIDDPFLDA